MQSTKSTDLIGHDKFLSWQQLDGCRVTRPFLSVKGVACETSTLGTTISEVATAGQHSNLSMQVWQTRTDKRKLSSLELTLGHSAKQKCPAFKGLLFFFKGPRSTMSMTVTGHTLCKFKGVALMQLRTYAVRTNALGTKLSFIECL